MNIKMKREIIFWIQMKSNKKFLYSNTEMKTQIAKQIKALARL